MSAKISKHFPTNLTKSSFLSCQQTNNKSAFRDFGAWVHLDWQRLSEGKISLLETPKSALWRLFSVCLCLVCKCVWHGWVTLIVRVAWPTPEAFYLSRKVSGWRERAWFSMHVTLSFCFLQFLGQFLCPPPPQFFLFENSSFAVFRNTSSSSSESHFLCFIHFTDAFVCLCIRDMEKRLQDSKNFNFLFFLKNLSFKVHLLASREQHFAQTHYNFIHLMLFSNFNSILVCNFVSGICAFWQD